MTKALLALVAFAVAMLLLLSGCGTENNGTTVNSDTIAVKNNLTGKVSNTTEKGILQGKVSIGPLSCPDYSIDPCQPTQAMYNTWPIAVWTADKKTKIASSVYADTHGNYSMELPAGEYFVNFEREPPTELVRNNLTGNLTRRIITRNNLPATITINAGETTTLNVVIDTGTGIRSSSPEKGILTGKVSIGKLCPGGTHCLPTQETYNEWPFAVWTADKKTKIASLSADSHGNYNEELSAGEYFVDLDMEEKLTELVRDTTTGNLTRKVVRRSTLPANVTINAGETTTLNIYIPTAIN